VSIIEHYIIVFLAAKTEAVKVDWYYELDDPKKNPGLEIWYEWGMLHRSPQAEAANPKPFFTPSDDHNKVMQPPKMSEEEKTKYLNDPKALESLHPIRKFFVECLFDPTGNKLKAWRKEQEQEQYQVLRQRETRYDEQKRFLSRQLTEAEKLELQQDELVKQQAKIKVAERKAADPLANLTTEERKARKIELRRASGERFYYKLKKEPADSPLRIAANARQKRKEANFKVKYDLRKEAPIGSPEHNSYLLYLKVQKCRHAFDKDRNNVESINALETAKLSLKTLNEEIKKTKRTKK
jgi:hypothetical protein